MKKNILYPLAFMVFTQMAVASGLAGFYESSIAAYSKLTAISCKSRVVGYHDKSGAIAGGDSEHIWSIHYYEERGRFRIELYQNVYLEDGSMVPLQPETSSPYAFVVYDGETSAHYVMDCNTKPYRYRVDLHAGRGPGSVAMLNGNLITSPLKGLLPSLRTTEADRVLTLSDITTFGSKHDLMDVLKMQPLAVIDSVESGFKSNLRYSMEALSNGSFPTRYIFDVSGDVFSGYSHEYKIDGKYVSLEKYEVIKYGDHMGVPFPKSAMLCSYNAGGESIGCGVIETIEFLVNEDVDDALFEITFQNVASISDTREGVVLELGHEGEVVSVNKL